MASMLWRSSAVMVCKMTSATVSRGGPAWRSMVTVTLRGRPVGGGFQGSRSGSGWWSCIGSVPGELGDGLLGASVVDEGFPVGGGGHEGGDGGVVERPGEAVGDPVEPGDSVIGDEWVGPADESEVVAEVAG